MAPTFPDTAVNTDRSNHGLWTAPRPSLCRSCAAPTASPPLFSPSPSPSPSPAPLSPRSSGDFSAASSPPSCTDSCESRRDPRIRNPGRRIAQVIRLRPECVEEYKKCHREAWPAVLKQIRESGIRDYHIYHEPSSNLLFATFVYVGYAFADDMARMRENAKVREWWRMTDGMQESLVEGATGSAEGEWWRDVESVFYSA